MQDDPNKTPASARHKRGCNCKKSSCLKKYCECYQGGVGCSISCRCEACKNAYGRKDGKNALPIKTIKFLPLYFCSEICLLLEVIVLFFLVNFFFLCSGSGPSEIEAEPEEETKAREKSEVGKASQKTNIQNTEDQSECALPTTPSRFEMLTFRQIRS